MPSLEAFYEIDPAVNVATITFDPSLGGRELQDLPVRNRDGELAAVVTFDATGTLVQIQLLDAARQVPRSVSRPD